MLGEGLRDRTGMGKRNGRMGHESRSKETTIPDEILRMRKRKTTKEDFVL